MLRQAVEQGEGAGAAQAFSSKDKSSVSANVSDDSIR